MKTNKTVLAVLHADEIDMGELAVRQPFPTNRFPQIDPFLLLHHADVKVPEDIDPGDAGVGPHPHRGFSPVTFIFKGGVHHRDSRGNDSVIYEGGVQWMRAGMGIIHSERAPENIHEIGGRQEIIQLWVNTPAKFKMDQPVYYPLKKEEMQEVISDDQLVTLKVVSGSLAGKKGSIPTQSPVNAATIYFSKGGHITIDIPPEHNTFIYLLDGKLNLSGYGIVEGLNAVIFKNDGDQLSMEALEDTRVLLMSGEPLHEKVESYGPFVMNSQTEIMQAMRDYKMGKMGVLIE
ncbi:MAG: pirin family protein [Chitinophagaceae bacterium]|nr:pirin family protein [Chitinophagaceae bacterium]